VPKRVGCELQTITRKISTALEHKKTLSGITKLEVRHEYAFQTISTDMSVHTETEEDLWNKKQRLNAGEIKIAGEGSQLYN
jgi:hypothetical protein